MNTTNSTQDAFASLRRSAAVLLTTFRRNGQGVSTPVGIQSGNGKTYFTTWSTTGKVKRLAHNPHVTLAPCTRRGKILGPTIAAIARRLDETQAKEISASLPKTFKGQMWNLIYKLRGWQPVIYELSPISADQADN